jgi:protein LSM14
LISKKNIRYEGMLYSINEQNATVALQNVRSFGTEGREITEPGLSFVAPAPDQVHPYLLFRGQDIKDLHVHEAAAAAAAAEAAAAEEAALKSNSDATATPATTAPLKAAAAPRPPAEKTAPPKQEHTKSAPARAAPQALEEKGHYPKPQGGGGRGSAPKREAGRGNGGGARRQRSHEQVAVGTGASLLKRTARGAVNGGASETPKNDFDFQSNLQDFEKEDAEDDEAGDNPDAGVGSYEKDDFFDSISCDALDKEQGIDKRIRGAQERNLNTETFGAVALNSQRRRKGRGGGRGRGRGGRGEGRGEGGRGEGRGRGRGRGRSSGRGGRSQTRRENSDGRPQSFASAAAASS